MFKQPEDLVNIVGAIDSLALSYTNSRKLRSVLVSMTGFEEAQLLLLSGLSRDERKQILIKPIHVRDEKPIAEHPRKP